MEAKDLNISRYYMILNNIYEVKVTNHAYKRALERGVTPDLIEKTIQCGKIKRFGKNRLKFISSREKNTFVCVDEIRGSRIFIVTVEVK